MEGLKKKKTSSMKRTGLMLFILSLGVFVSTMPLFGKSSNVIDQSMLSVNQTLKTVSDGVSRLFDIKMDLENAQLLKSEDLRATIAFTSFGKVPTPVNMVFKVFDKDDDAVYAESQSLTVETENVLVKEFPKLNIPSGKYTLVLSTNYNGNVNDDFKQSFEVKDTGLLSRIGNTGLAIIVSVGGVLLLWGLYRVFGADWF